MHKKVNPYHNRNVGILVVSTVLAVVIAAVLVVIFTGTSSGSIRMQTITQPASAAQVAKGLHCVRFKDQGAAAVFSDDSGSCFIGSKKYAINTFPDKASRDSWLGSAAQLGVVPKWKTPTSVVYPSLLINK